MTTATGFIDSRSSTIINTPIDPDSTQNLMVGRSFRMGVHHFPKDEGSWKNVPPHQRVCLLCDSGSLCDEKHIWYLNAQLYKVCADKYASWSVEVCTIIDAAIPVAT